MLVKEKHYIINLKQNGFINHHIKKINNTDFDTRIIYILFALFRCLWKNCNNELITY